jgi:hypothetical protein
MIPMSNTAKLPSQNKSLFLGIAFCLLTGVFAFWSSSKPVKAKALAIVQEGLRSDSLGYIWAKVLWQSDTLQIPYEPAMPLAGEEIELVQYAKTPQWFWAGADDASVFSRILGRVLALLCLCIAIAFLYSYMQYRRLRSYFLQGQMQESFGEVIVLQRKKPNNRGYWRIFIQHLLPNGQVAVFRMRSQVPFCDAATQAPIQVGARVKFYYLAGRPQFFFIPSQLEVGS